MMSIWPFRAQLRHAEVSTGHLHGTTLKVVHAPGYEPPRLKSLHKNVICHQGVDRGGERDIPPILEIVVEPG